MASAATALKTRPLSKLEEDELLDRAQRGEREAFDELVARTSSSAMKLAVSILRDASEAEDEVQNSFWKAWQSLPRFQREAKFGTWIHRIVVNQCLMRLRSLRRAPVQSLEEPVAEGSDRVWEPSEQGPNPEQRLGRQEIQDLVRREVRRLPALLREPLIASALENRSLEEIAARMGLSVPAVKSRLRRARQELKSRLEKHQGRVGPATLAV